MPSALALGSVILAATCVAISADQSDKTKAPKKGDVLVVRGCLRGSAVESAQAMVVDNEGTPHVQDQIPPLTYRLQGDKGLLKDLKQKHDRMIVEVKGILRSELSRSGIGTDVGRTRITIGVDPRSARAGDQPVPVLEATSFEGSSITCGR
jgi:hypothetical protein